PARPGRVGARVLPEVPEPAARLRLRLVERGQLGQRQPALPGRQGLSRLPRRPVGQGDGVVAPVALPLRLFGDPPFPVLSASLSIPPGPCFPLPHFPVAHRVRSPLRPDRTPSPFGFPGPWNRVDTHRLSGMNREVPAYSGVEWTPHVFR